MLQRAYSEKPYEFILTILVVFAAVMAAFTGYSSAVNGEDETDFRGEGQSKLAAANTLALELNQILIRDERLLDNADLVEIIGETDFALTLRNKTFIVQLGYLDQFGNPTPAFSNRSEAVDAYIEDLSAPQRALQNASDQAFVNANIASENEVNFLLATILFALGAVLASQGLTADSRRVRRIFTYIVVGFLVFPVGFTIFAVLT